MWKGREGRSTFGLETRPVDGSNGEMSRTRRRRVLVKPVGKLKRKERIRMRRAN